MKILLRYTILSFILVSGHAQLFAQTSDIKISGIVVELDGVTPIPFATVAVVEDSTNNILTGGTTGENGQFKLTTTAGAFYIEISFIGYKTKTVNEFSAVAGVVDLGPISMEPDNEILQEVEIVAEKSQTEFKLDKRVFNVGQDISSTGMGALEVLNNVPSVTVNIEGEVALRGNSGVTILINGKPSVLADEASNALGTITADMIESVEVITNPSAKYEASGTAGIINIVLKKEEKKGINGSVTLNTGIPHNHSLGLSLNRRTEKFNVFTQIGAGYRSLPRESENVNLNRIDGTSILSDGTAYRNEQFYNITLGTDYYLNPRNTITLSGNYAYEIEEQPSEFNFSEIDADNTPVSKWEREETASATNPKWQYDLQYQREFEDNEDHTLLFSTQGSFFGKDVTSEFTNTPVYGSPDVPFQKTENAFSKADYLFKLDYTKPIKEKITLEAGGQYEINDVRNDYAVFNELDGSLVLDSSLTNNFEYDQSILGLYTTLSYEGKKWGVKAGLRGEHTNLETYLTNTGEDNKRNFLNFFPSAHASYKFNKRVSAQLGYSRRIQRPRLWDLNPFFNIRNNYNINRGNPDLLPQFTDSYELTGIFIYEKISLNTGVYNLYTTDVIERVSTVEGNVNTRMPENIGTNNTTGLEINAKYSPVKWTTLSADFNYGFFVRKGTFEDQVFDFEGTQWTSRLTAKFKMPAEFDLELNGNYRSKVKTIQGETAGFPYLDLGLRKKVWKGKMVVNFAIRDVFASRKREYTANETDFYLFNSSQRGTFFTLGVSYGFGKGEAMTYSSGRRH